MYMNENLVAIYDKFITQAECDYVINLIDTKETFYSKVKASEIYGVPFEDDTISETEFLMYDTEDEILNSIKSKIQNLVFALNPDVELELDSEFVVKLHDSTVMKNHYDSSTDIMLYREKTGLFPEQSEYHNISPIVTCLLYLNEVDSGGSLHFENLIDMQVSSGRLAVFWGSKFPHHASPFEKTRYNIAIWFKPKHKLF